MSRLVRNHILKALIHEVKALQEIIATSNTRKCVCKGVIKMPRLQDTNVSSSMATNLDLEKDVVTMDKDEEMSNAKEEIGDEDM